jgi:hypothetical protein
VIAFTANAQDVAAADQQTCGSAKSTKGNTGSRLTLPTVASDNP